MSIGDGRKRGRTAAALVVASTVFGVGLWAVAWARSQPGFEQVGLAVIGAGAIAAALWTLSLAYGLFRGRRWAVTGARASYAVAAAGALFSAIDTLRRVRGFSRPYGAPATDLIPPTTFLILSAAILLELRRGKSSDD